jgi:hypothetical protein
MLNTISEILFCLSKSDFGKEKWIPKDRKFRSVFKKINLLWRIKTSKKAHVERQFSETLILHTRRNFLNILNYFKLFLGAFHHPLRHSGEKYSDFAENFSVASSISFRKILFRSWFFILHCWKFINEYLKIHK